MDSCHFLSLRNKMAVAPPIEPGNASPVDTISLLNGKIIDLLRHGWWRTIHRVMDPISPLGECTLDAQRCSIYRLLYKPDKWTAICQLASGNTLEESNDCQAASTRKIITHHRPWVDRIILQPNDRHRGTDSLLLGKVRSTLYYYFYLVEIFLWQCVNSITFPTACAAQWEYFQWLSYFFHNF